MNDDERKAVTEALERATWEELGAALNKIKETHTKRAKDLLEQAAVEAVKARWTFSGWQALADQAWKDALEREE